jgi:hypothetical protein
MSLLIYLASYTILNSHFILIFFYKYNYIFIQLIFCTTLTQQTIPFVPQGRSQEFSLG